MSGQGDQAGGNLTESPPEGEELVVVSGPKLDWSRPALWCLPGLFVPALFSVLRETTLVLERDLPWISREGMLGFVFAYVIASPIAFSLVYQWWYLPRTGTARLTSTGVHVAKRKTNERFLPWVEVSGVSAARPHSLQLHTKGERRPDRFWTLPTPDEATRVQLMALLDERGIKQL